MKKQAKKTAYPKDFEQDLWRQCVAFHGHECGGLTIGYQAALYAMELLNLNFSSDEEVVCISENDACGVDAIQVVLGCSVGKGNLLFHMTGKQAFSFYQRASQKSLRLVLRERPVSITRENALAYYRSLAPKDLFDVKETKIILPERAQIFTSFNCENCGEKTASNWIRLQGDKKVCLDCFEDYRRFNI